jgi:ankyrin repeat protein
MHIRILLKIAVLTACFTQTASAMKADKNALNQRLLKAVKNNKIVELLKCGANINVQDNYGITALCLACLHNSKDAIKLLIENGADINLQDNYGSTPLYNLSE